jgi:hypothetical protein
MVVMLHNLTRCEMGSAKSGARFCNKYMDRGYGTGLTPPAVSLRDQGVGYRVGVVSSRMAGNVLAMLVPRCGSESARENGPRERNRRKSD